METEGKEALLHIIIQQIRAGNLEMPISQFAHALGMHPLCAYEYVQQLEREGKLIEIGRGQNNRPLYVLNNEYSPYGEG